MQILLKKKIKNYNLLKINILNGRYKKHGPFKHLKILENLLPISIEEIKTIGKFMYWKIDNLYLGFSLGLMGGWIFRNNNKFEHALFPLEDHFDEDEIKEYRSRSMKHLNIEFVFESGSLYFYDQLSFGSIKIFESFDEINKKIKKMGLDIMDPETSLELFIEKINQKKNLKKEIGKLLLDQKIIAGIGNYLRADLLWLSHVSPFRKVKDINNKELNIMYKNIRLLTWTLYDYDKAIKLKIIDKNDKLPINYKNEFLVYNRDKDIYNNPVIKEKQYDGSNIRYIHWVQKLQK
jgi:formamidopyrimidine-DNA glycosylase